MLKLRATESEREREHGGHLWDGRGTPVGIHHLGTNHIGITLDLCLDDTTPYPPPQIWMLSAARALTPRDGRRTQVKVRPAPAAAEPERRALAQHEEVILLLREARGEQALEELRVLGAQLRELARREGDHRRRVRARLTRCRRE